MPILFIGCKKESTQQAQPYTVYGNYSFLINGNILDAYGNSTNGNTRFCNLIQANGNTYLYIGGNRTSGAFPSVVLEAYIKMPSTNIQSGTYSSTDVGNYFKIQFQYDNRCACYDRYVSNTTNIISFKIVSYNSSTKEVTCEFSGKLQKENNTQVVNITNGRINGNLP